LWINFNKLLVYVNKLLQIFSFLYILYIEINSLIVKVFIYFFYTYTYTYIRKNNIFIEKRISINEKSSCIKYKKTKCFLPRRAYALSGARLGIGNVTLTCVPRTYGNRRELG